ncbi:MAG: MarR family transcriptional regulator [Flavobacteriales bacterium]|nr:MarR family transcriptional regulator [Flavobacteriales bacterium]
MASIDEEIKSKFKDDRQRLVVNLAYTAGWLRNRHIEFLKPFDVSPQQFNILRILRGAKDWVAMSIVKDRMVEKAPNATRLADKLMDKSLIERRRCDEDRRVVYVHIAEKGLALLKEIDEKHEEAHFAVAASISLEDAKFMSNLLDELRG